MSRVRKLRQRRSEIIKSLSDLARDGWNDARGYDYAPLEAELREIETELSKRRAA